MRIRTLLAASAVAIAGIMATMAYNQATVNSAATARVVTSENALLALSCKSPEEAGNKDETCSIKNGALHLNFERGFGDDDNGDKGFQPNSTYEFQELVVITNNSNETVDVTVGTDGNLFNTDGLTVSLDPTSKSSLDPNGSFSVSFTLVVDENFNAESTTDLTGTITVTATAQ